MATIYSWRPGFRAKEKAEVVGPILEELERSEEGLTAQSLVDFSRPEDAPTHKMFEWDDAVAAEEYRKSQARVIIASIETKYDTTPEPFKRYFNLRYEEPEYTSIEVIKDSEEDMTALLELATRELRAFEKKYAILRKELKAVFDAIDNMEE